MRYWANLLFAAILTVFVAGSVALVFTLGFIAGHVF